MVTLDFCNHTHTCIQCRKLVNAVKGYCEAGGNVVVCDTCTPALWGTMTRPALDDFEQYVYDIREKRNNSLIGRICGMFRRFTT